MMKHVALCGVFAGIFLTVSVWPGLAQNTYQQIYWDYDKGLPTQSNYDHILQSKSGYLWCATGAGIVRFDGQGFRLYTNMNSGMFSGPISTLFEDSENRLWYGGEMDGFGFLQGEKPLSFTHPGYVKRFAETPDNVLWIGTDGNGLWKMDMKAETPAPERVFAQELGLTIYDFHMTHSGTLHVAAHNGLFTIHGDSLAAYPVTQGTLVTSVRSDTTGIIWYGTNNGLYQLGEGISRQIPFFSSPVVTRILQLDSHPDEGLLALTERGLYTLRNSALVPITESDNRLKKSVTTDHEGGIWIGMEMYGLLQLIPTDVKILGQSAGLPGNIATVITQARDETIYVGTTEGLAVIQPEGSSIEILFEESVITSLLEDNQNRMWVALREEGVRLLQDGIWYPMTREDGLPSNTVWTLYQDSGNRILAGTQNGIGVFSDETGWGEPITSADLLLNNDVRVIRETGDGDLWVGTSWGLHHFREDTVTVYTTDHGLESGVILDVVDTDDGSIWIATLGGLHRFRDNVMTLVPGELGESELSRIIPVGTDLWIAGSGSVTIIDWESLNRRIDDGGSGPEVTRYDRNNGLPGEIVGTIQPSGWAMRNGEIWFPTNRGAAIFHPENRQQRLPPPPVVINYSLAGRDTLQSPQSIVLPRSRDRLDISYTAFSYSRPQSLSYFYRLADFDEDWNHVGNRRTAIYTNIPPGEYRFEVKARIGDGPFSVETASVPVTIIPAFYETFWFRGLMAGGFVLVFWSVYSWRMHSLKKMEELRVRIANDLHDEIGSNLGSIALRSRMLSRQAHSDETLGNLLEIDMISRQTAVAMRDIIWFINPGKDRVDDLQYKLKQVASQLLVDIPFDFDAKATNAQNIVPLQVRRNTIFIFKEILHNIIKHADASLVEINLLNDSKKMVLSVSDDGKGFDEFGVTSDGIGLTSMQRRAGEMKARLLVDSVPQKGTRVKVIIPIT